VAYDARTATLHDHRFIEVCVPHLTTTLLSGAALPTLFDETMKQRCGRDRMGSLAGVSIGTEMLSGYRRPSTSGQNKNCSPRHAKTERSVNFHPGRDMNNAPKRLHVSFLSAKLINSSSRGWAQINGTHRNLMWNDVWQQWLIQHRINSWFQRLVDGV